MELESFMNTTIGVSCIHAHMEDWLILQMPQFSGDCYVYDERV